MIKRQEEAVAVAAQPFSALREAIAKQFAGMSQHALFRTDVSKDALWEEYLGAFRPEDNPLHKTRTEHDCQCCRHFIRSVGGVVAIVDGDVFSLWDGDACVPERYRPSVAAMRALVHNASIVEPFFSDVSQVGTAKTFQQMVTLMEFKTVAAPSLSKKEADATGKEVITWAHFHLTLPPGVVCKKDDIGPRTSEARGTKDSMLRSLQEISLEAVDSVLELIAQNSLYHGEEHKFVVEAFRKLKMDFLHLLTESALVAQHDTVAELNRAVDIFCWSKLAATPAPGAKMRGTVIGTLLTDLSEGKDLDAAVAAFESKVAPASYKRPTALVTKAMIEKARATVEELGYATALERRFAVLEDVTVENILFADRSARRVMGAVDVFDGLVAKVAERPSKLDKVEEVPVERFLAEVMPRAVTLEVMLENRHAGNLVSLMAPADPTAKGLFKWPNGFSWSYAGEVADSMKERVKRAGGSVTGVLCCRLAWDYTDDLDFHMQEPPPGAHIYYGCVRQKSPLGGELDLDANGRDGMKEHPVENIYYADDSRLREGVYRLYVNNYNQRSSGKGFDVELEFGGHTVCISYEKALRTGENVTVAQLRYSKAKGFELVESLPASTAVKPLWGLDTQGWRRVNVLMLSPNYWTGDSAPVKPHSDEHKDQEQRRIYGVGNKHWFFMLDGCLNDGRARGFYNEFLKEELTPHRKVFELVGAKLSQEGAERQLSGLGFSSTNRSSLFCRVGGATTRVVKVVF